MVATPAATPRDPEISFFFARTQDFPGFDSFAESETLLQLLGRTAFVFRNIAADVANALPVREDDIPQTASETFKSRMKGDDRHGVGLAWERGGEHRDKTGAGRPGKRIIIS